MKTKDLIQHSIISSVLFVFLVISSCALTNCAKKTEVSGRVYSKYNYPMANVDITLLDYLSSKYPDESIITSTDAGGYYSFKLKAKRNHIYWITSRSDSGITQAKKLKIGTTNQVDLKYQ